MDEYIGIIKIFAGSFAPRGWMLCQGQLLPISQYSALYSILGVVYGGDGVTNFALPNLSGLVPLGTGRSFSGSTYMVGEIGGSEATTLTVQNIPPHKHNTKAHASTANASSSQPSARSVVATAGKPQGRDFEAFNAYSDATPDVLMSDQFITEDVVGSGVPIKNMQPFMAINHIICIDGLYPSRP